MRRNLENEIQQQQDLENTRILLEEKIQKQETKIRKAKERIAR